MSSSSTISIRTLFVPGSGPSVHGRLSGCSSGVDRRACRGGVVAISFPLGVEAIDTLRNIRHAARATQIFDRRRRPRDALGGDVGRAPFDAVSHARDLLRIALRYGAFQLGEFLRQPLLELLQHPLDKIEIAQAATAQSFPVQHPRRERISPWSAGGNAAARLAGIRLWCHGIRRSAPHARSASPCAGGPGMSRLEGLLENLAYGQGRGKPRSLGPGSVSAQFHGRV